MEHITLKVKHLLALALTASLIPTVAAVANPANHHQKQFSQSAYIAALNKQLTNSSLIDTLLKKARETKTSYKRTFYYTAAANLNSGIAYLYLGHQNQKTKPYSAIDDYLSAAKYGYPESYGLIAKLYLDGKKGIKRNPLLAHCYLNLTTKSPDYGLIQICQNNYPAAFKIEPQKGLQSADEVINKAASDYRHFCDNPNRSALLNANIGKPEANVLSGLICGTRLKKGYVFETGDVLLKHNKLYQYSASGLSPYKKPATDGLVVYRINPPVSMYIVKHKKLIPAQNGDQIIKDGKAFIVKGNRLVEFNA